MATIMELVCPYCERPLEGHNEQSCKRRMSRRFFLGAATGVVLACALPKAAGALSAPPPTAWFSGAAYMLSAKDGSIVTSEFHGTGKIRGHYGMPLDQEIAQLQSEGFDVFVSDKAVSAQMEYHKRVSEQVRIINDERNSAGSGMSDREVALYARANERLIDGPLDSMGRPTYLKSRWDAAHLEEGVDKYGHQIASAWRGPRFS